MWRFKEAVTFARKPFFWYTRIESWMNDTFCLIRSRQLRLRWLLRPLLASLAGSDPISFTCDKSVLSSRIVRARTPESAKIHGDAVSPHPFFNSIPNHSPQIRCGRPYTKILSRLEKCPLTLLSHLELYASAKNNNDAEKDRRQIKVCS